MKNKELRLAVKVTQLEYPPKEEKKELEVAFDKEEWKDIPNYEGHYQVSSMGNIRSIDKTVMCRFNKTRNIKGLVLSKRINPEGRYYVILSKESKKRTFKVHKLVAMAFLNHIPCGYSEVVDHINNDPLDNRVENLQIITARHNVSKDRKNKSSIYTGVWFCKTTKKWKSEIRNGKKRISVGTFENEEGAHIAYLEKLKLI